MRRPCSSLKHSLWQMVNWKAILKPTYHGHNCPGPPCLECSDAQGVGEHGLHCWSHHSIHYWSICHGLQPPVFSAETWPEPDLSPTSYKCTPHSVQAWPAVHAWLSTNTAWSCGWINSVLHILWHICCVQCSSLPPLRYMLSIRHDNAV